MFRFGYGTVTRYGRTFPERSPHDSSTTAWSYNPVYALPHMRFGLFPGRSPLLGESFVYFLFLQVLRCFSSLRLPLYFSTDNHPSGDWVVPFGNLGIRGYLHLPQAYRSLSRPSSPPRAKASTRRPNFLSPFTYIIYFNIQRKVAHTISCNLRFNSVKKTKSFTYSLVCQYVKDLYPRRGWWRISGSNR